MRNSAPENILGNLTERNSNDLRGINYEAIAK